MKELPIAFTLTDADYIGSTVVNARGGPFFDPAPRRTRYRYFFLFLGTRHGVRAYAAQPTSSNFG